jgi:biotin-(acetyl-CoA carboxylase) ligase
LAAAPALTPTSIREELGVEIDMRLLRDKILHALTWYQAEWERGMYRKLVERIQPTIPWLGRKVRVETRSHDVLVGRAERLDDTGSLVLAGVERPRRDLGDNGPTETLSPGDVELVRVAD